MELVLNESADADRLRGVLREIIGTKREGGRGVRPGAGSRETAVLLLGDVPAPGSADGIPTFRVAQPDHHLADRRDAMFASDGPYQDLDDDGVPDLMLGRVPVGSLDSARAFLAKIRAAESAPPMAPARCVEVVGGEGRFGPYDALLEVLTASLFLDCIPAEIDLRVSYAKATSPFCPPPSRLASTVREQALSGAFLFNYIGHGHPEGLDRLVWRGQRLRILDSSNLGADGAVLATPSPGGERVRPAVPGGVALLVCCSTGWFDLPKGDCFAEALLRQPTGPIAVIAGSRPTHPYANAIVEREALRRLLGDHPAIVGEWDLAVTRALATIDRDPLDLIAAPIALSQKWPMSLSAMRRQHALLYNLLGDPTSRLAPAPRAPEGSITIGDDGVLRGSVPGASGGTVRVSLEEKRRPVRAGIEPAQGDAADLEARAASTWPRANDWSLWRTEVPLVDGRFSTPLPDPLPSGAAHLVIVATAAPDPASDDTGASGTAEPPMPAILAVESIDLSSLVRFRGDGEGLPSDRGTRSR